MDEFLTASYNTEEEIKTALKFIPQINLDDKMEKVNTTLLRECTVNTHLPLEITASVSHVKSHSNRIQDYKAKVRYINGKNKTEASHYTVIVRQKHKQKRISECLQATTMSHTHSGKRKQWPY